MDVASGQVLGADAPRNDSFHFVAFLEEIDAAVPAHLAIHLVMDNGSSHVSKATKAWLADHPRFVAHYTPTPRLLAQPELFFSILTRRLLKRGEFASRADLVDRIMRFIADYDTTAAPFKWTYDGRPVKAA
ncbi:MAG: transposase [Euzebyales bacterium]|nr:transposase [Euzebyales bacterium]